MSTDTQEAEVVESTALSKIDYSAIVTADVVANVEACCALTINGLEDTAGYKLADTKRKELVRIRRQIDKHKDDINADAKRFIERNKEEANRWQALIGPAEDHVTKLVDDYKEAVAKADRDARDAAFNAKNERLKAAGIVVARIVVDSWTEADIVAEIAKANELARLRMEEAARQAAELAERQRIEAEERRVFAEQQAELAKQREALEIQRNAEAIKRAAEDAERARLAKIEADKLAAERAELKRQQDEHNERLAAERAKVEHELALAQAERKRIADAEAARETAEREAKEKIEAAERQARLDAERKVREEQEAKDKAEREEAVRLQREAEKPLIDKVNAFAEKVEKLKVPDGKYAEDITTLLKSCATDIRDLTLPF